MTSGLSDFHEQHGDPSTWAELSGEETRCLLGLKAYYVKIVGTSEEQAFSDAWKDLQNEFERLKEFPWFRCSN